MDRLWRKGEEGKHGFTEICDEVICIRLVAVHRQHLRVMYIHTNTVQPDAAKLSHRVGRCELSRRVGDILRESLTV